jgi:hypothetical protein
MEEYNEDNATWIVVFPGVTGFVSHEEEMSFPVSLTTNEKGGTDIYVLVLYAL